jgi:tetratricopeptide (TPR) repeat protein
MFAMVSPAGKGVRKPFNWGRVLRHELVHIFNLEQTHFLVPHWFTEGLAVINEGYPRPQIWNELLLKKVPANQLLNLDTIDLGFIRPRSPEEWNQAYCQAQMYVLFLQKEYGQEKVGEMLTAYRDGLDTAAALTRVCKTDKATFEKGYRAYVDAVYRTLHGKPAEKALTLAQLKEAHEKEPDNADLSARLAEQLMRRDKIEARKLVDGVLKAKPNHPLASLVKAKLVLQGGDAEGARKLMEEALDRGQPEPALLLELGKLYYDANEMDKAREMFELGRQAEPYSSQWLVQLARVHAQADDKEKLIAVLKDLVPLDADDLDSRKRLARLLAQAGRNAEAEAYARQCLEIDIRDKEARETLVKALEAQKKDAEAAKLQEQLGK